jgi:hypothetical protein
MPRRHGHIPVWARFSPTAVDALMALCDRLEASLDLASATTAARAMEAAE